MGVDKLKTKEKHPAIDAIELRKDTPPKSNRLCRALCVTGIAASMLTVGLAVNLLQLLAAPLTLINRPLAHRIQSFATLFAWTLTQYFIEKQDNVRLTVSGEDKIPESENAFVIANHAFFGDFFLVHVIASRKRMMKYCRYFLKDSIRYIPIFGWGMYLCNMPFLKRNWQRDSRNISQSLCVFTENRLPVWLVSHVEGSRLSQAKLQKCHEYAHANNLPILNNVLLPRCKGFISTINELRGSYIKVVYDITLVYYHQKKGFGATPTLWEILTGDLTDYQMHVHIDRIPIADLPKGEAQLSEWLYDSYIKKDSVIAQIKDAFERKAKQL